MKLHVEKYPKALGDNAGPWFIADDEGYQVSGNTFDTKREATEALRVMRDENARIDESQRKYQAGIDYVCGDKGDY